MPWWLAARAFLGKIPRWTWIAIAVAAFLTSAIVWHQHHAHAALKAAYASGYTRAKNEDRDAALKLKAKADALSANIADLERRLNDEENRRIAGSANDLRLSGPGKASCGRSTIVPAATGQSRSSGGSGNAAMAPLPDPTGIDLIGLPFADAIGFGEEHDLDRAEALSWRVWYAKLLASWPK